ncbi:MAG: hypothetical protein CSA52_03800 [Gammaproteobacteria bacterium]|nr:MAG: hypothetical protein CSB48_10520 [Pseudomonadota bacterium]PIE38004.1 MAG: hypothetical protein CSA52_03800 [Gammaproteobacteria bacterium]
MTIALKTLIDFLDSDLNDLTRLEEVLNKERHALQERDLPQIEQSQQLKQELLQCLEQRARSKSTYLAKECAPKAPPTFSMLVKVSSNAELKSKWQLVQSLLNQCKQANSVNGKIISHSQQRVTRIMEIIRGQSRQSSLYGARGKKETMSGSCVLARA